MFVFIELNLEVIVCFGDIGGIVDPHCFSFFFITQYIFIKFICLIMILIYMIMITKIIYEKYTLNFLIEIN